MSEETAIRIDRFEPRLVDDVPETRTSTVLASINRGFHESELDTEDLRILTGITIADNTTFTAAYDESAVQPSLHTDAPVATYASFPGTLNIGEGNLMPVHQITAVTVSPTHRRRGLLRRVMTEDLTLARAAGMAFAALTASEATIYGRFGFGRVTQRARFALNVSRGLPMRGSSEGSVVAVDPKELAKYAPAIFAAAHARKLGSISATEFDVGQAAGSWVEHDSPKPAKNLRAALHLDAQGRPDGFMSYQFSGWKHSPPTMEIGQMCTVTGAGRRELLAYLASHDLIEKIIGSGPIDDVVPSALENPRSYKVNGLGDHLWLRILDLETALEARNYGADGNIRLRVKDDLHFTDGDWDLSVSAGIATVRRAPEGSEPDVTLDIRDLASLFLGGFRATHLAQAGVLVPRTPAALATINAIFATDTIPYCQADF